MEVATLITLTMAATLCNPGAARAPTSHYDVQPLHQHIANVSYAGKRDNKNPTGFSSLFSPRMDFEQWKPLTGRGDPLRNDPTYDYEPPVLERVHYWADETRYEREHYPERKSEVLMLGVSSRRPSVATHVSVHTPYRLHQPPSHPPKYDKYSYKLSDRYPMTILVPPPPPPPGHLPTLFAEEDKPLTTSHVKFTDSPTIPIRNTTLQPERFTSSYDLQEANLIYQSSSVSHNWINDQNQTNSYISNVVSSDYAGWGPTTPIDNNEKNDTHNFIFKDDNDYRNNAYLFYRPVLSEAPPPPERIPISFNGLNNPQTLLPTTVASTPIAEETSITSEPSPSPQPDFGSTVASYDFEEETVTDKQMVNPTTSSYTPTKPDGSVFDMMASMLSMPLLNGAERPEDNLYAHASENVQVFKEQSTENINVETMQTMQPPSPSIVAETSTSSHKRPFHVKAHLVNHLAHRETISDPYLYLRHTTSRPLVVSSSGANTRATTESTSPNSYLIIQGHSKVKTYGSIPKNSKNHTAAYDSPKLNETNEVKHLHSNKDKHVKKTVKPIVNRLGRVTNLQTLVDRALGSIEIQEADVGIQYDVSDGSEVPIEIYRKGIVENNENDYRKSKKEKRQKRQLSLEDFVPFDEDTLEEFVYNFLESKRNTTGITGLIAKAVTGNATSIIDALEDDDEEDER